MKIAVVDTTIHSDLIGGAQTFLPDLLAGLKCRGHDVHFIARGKPNAKVEPQLIASGVEMYTDLWNPSRIADDNGPIFAKWVNNLAPDVFVISTTPDLGWVILPLLSETIATVSIAHSNADTYYQPLEYYRLFVTKAVGVSHEICENFLNKCGLLPAQIDWIPYGITPSEDAPEAVLSSPDPINLVYVGRLYEEQKRVSDLYKLVAELERRGLDYSFRIIGEGPMMPTMQEQMSAEIESGKVSFLGWLGNAELLENLRDCEVFLLVSDSEGFPIALVEAMANGCAPVVTDIKSGTVQLVENGVNGFIVPVGDTAALADRVGVLSTDGRKLLEFRKKAWETGRQYSVDRMVDAYEDCFERAVAEAWANPRKPDPDLPLMKSCQSRYPLWLRRIKAKAQSLVG